MTTEREGIRRPTASSCRSTAAGSSSTRPACASWALGAPGAGLDETFADVVDLAAACRFADCAHGTEPGCAVQEALAEGRLTEDRLESYRKLQRELQWQELKSNPRRSPEARRARQRSRSLRNNTY